MSTLAPPRTSTSDAVLLRKAADRRLDDAEQLEAVGNRVAANKAERDAYVLYRYAHVAASYGGRCPLQAVVTHARAVLGGTR